MEFYILASGSTGNCTALVNDNKEILLVDCGIAIKTIKERLESVGLSFDNVKKVILTHMHEDHCKSVSAFDLDDVYVNSINSYGKHQFEYYETLNILGFEILTLPMSHDSPGTTGFLIKYKDEKMAYITDTGYVSENVQQYLNNCDYYLVESNHDPRMLMLTKRPAFLKSRILSSSGHLSNEDCMYMLSNVIGPSTRKIIFIHRSQEANSEPMIAETLKKVVDKTQMDISNISFAIAKADEIVSFLDTNILFY